MSSSSIQKTPIPKQLLGVPSDFDYDRESTEGTRIYPSDYKNKAITIDMDIYSDVNLIFYKYNDDEPIYLDIDINLEYTSRQRSGGEALYLRYSDESEKNMVYLHMDAPAISIKFPMYKGWYMQKRTYRSGNPVPDLFKL